MTLTDAEIMEPFLDSVCSTCKKCLECAKYDWILDPGEYPCWKYEPARELSAKIGQLGAK